MLMSMAIRRKSLGPNVLNYEEQPLPLIYAGASYKHCINDSPDQKRILIYMKTT